MKQKSILITGCSSGIGLTCAHGMKERGWQVFATARKQEDIDGLKADGITALYLDYTDTASIHTCLAEVLKQTGGTLDAVFNNGGYGQMGAVEDVKTDDLRRQFETLVFGWHELSRTVMPIMRAQGGGRIVQCSSVLGFVSLKYRAAYSASKHALEALSTAMRLEAKPWNIHTSSIQPGPIATRFLPNAKENLLKTIDLKASPYASSYEEQMNRLNKGDTSSKFKLPPEAVLEKLIHATESSNPKPNYYVTTPTHIMGLARRLLPARLLDYVLDKGS